MLALCSDAGAATTIGSTLSVAPETSLCGGSSTYTNTSLAGTLAAPFDGVIVRWRMDLAEPGGANLYTLRVLRPATATTYTGVGTSAALTAPSAGLNVLTLPTPLPVQAGDIVGMECQKDAPIPSTTFHGLPTTTFAYFAPPLGEGKTAAPSNKLPGEEMLFNADVVGPPSVASISTTGGPASGGTAVTLIGSHLGEVSAVDFGASPATSFTLVSEGELHAIAPPGTGGTSVDVSVVNAAGSATAAQPFGYEAVPAAGPSPVAGGGGPATEPLKPPTCRVPSVRGKTLAAGKKAIRKAHCGVGKVVDKGAPGKGGEIVRQKPKPGKTLKPGTKVNLVLGPK